MKNLILSGILLIIGVQLSAQVKSSHDGFYSADSVFYQLTGNANFKYCVNCYSADSLRIYKGGVWLHSREYAPNTWENSRFSMEPESGDTNHIRPDVAKGNTIWVRIFNDTGFIDQYHFVFLGNWRPKTAQVVSICLDSTDFFGAKGFYGPGDGLSRSYKYRWNYLLKMEKKCSYQVFAGANWQPETEQEAGIEMSANYSAVYPSKAMQLNANWTSNKEKLLVLGKSLTDSLGPDIKVLRFRVGGANHRSNILANEIALDIIRPEIGGEHSIPVCLFVNGSFWTYAFAEEGMGPNHIAKVTHTERNELLTLKVPVVISMNDLKKKEISFTQTDKAVYNVCGFSNVCQFFYAYNDTLQFEVDPTEKAYSISKIETLCGSIKTGNNTLLASIIDREAFYRYALSIWFFQNPEGWARRLTLVKPGDKPWKPFSEHYDFEPQQPWVNDWDTYFTNFIIPAHYAAKKTMPWQATNRMLKYEPDYICLVFEDELNTTYKPERTMLLAKKKIASLRPCIAECSKAWGPNDWQDSMHWETAVSGMLPFLKIRPLGIASALPQIFMTGADTLFTLDDMRDVSVKFDSVVGKNVTVKLNSLELREDFTGKYYPRPELRISLLYDASKYKFVKWLEYPNNHESFRLSANKQITLTPIFKLRTEKKK